MIICTCCLKRILKNSGEKSSKAICLMKSGVECSDVITALITVGRKKPVPENLHCKDLPASDSSVLWIWAYYNSHFAA